MLDGEVVEDPEDDGETAEDVETGTKTCSIVPGTDGDKTEEIFERLNLERGEVTEAPDDDLETNRQSEAENIVRDLIDIVIADIIM